MGRIYLIKNHITGKVYVGQTRYTLQHRLTQHIEQAGKDNSVLHKSMKKHGVENFTIELLENVENNKLNEREIYWIAKYNSIIPNGYNMTAGGGGISGYRHTSIVKKRISIVSARYMREMSEEDRKARGEKISQYFRGKPKSEEHKRNLSKSRMGKYTGTENPFYGREHTEETKRKIGDANRGRVSNRRIPVRALRNGTEKDFSCMLDAFYWLSENGYCKSKNYTSVLSTIKRALSNNDYTAYGFKWYYLESVETIPDGSRAEMDTARSALYPAMDKEIVHSL
jgi:group I intron endonuclease